MTIHLIDLSNLMIQSNLCLWQIAHSFIIFSQRKSKNRHNVQYFTMSSNSRFSYDTDKIIYFP